MPNTSNESGKDEQRFVEDVARLLMPWGVPPVAARLYGYLLRCPRPVSLDQITEDPGDQQE
jgi:DNA-binding transcriptional regulator GbsR (MarR family)